MTLRQNTRRVMCGSVPIGGGAPISVQSMLNAATVDTAACIEQAARLKKAGCDIVRAGVPNEEAARALGPIARAIGMPLVADIHYDYRLALIAIEQGVSKLRLNPGNIGSKQRVREVARAAQAAGVPIRIGVNAGSLEKELLDRFGPTPEAMAQSALGHARLLEDCGFYDIVIALKASDVARTMKACQLVAEACNYPLHLGITESGTLTSGLIVSSAGLGAMLMSGIGDTIRYSLAADPVEEVRAGVKLLRALGLRAPGPRVIACPTCARRRSLDVFALAEAVEHHLEGVDVPMTVAVMGCAVNGPGEARQADIGVAGGDGKGLLFMKGEVVGAVPQDKVLPALLEAVDALIKEKSHG
nr:flavodoxin-dependent (E)-4-hydroxy-3-methylbut-2-enyl-diphosphate synthase [bacterium]